MWLALQHSEPDDFIFSTGQQFSVRDFVREAFGLWRFDIEWRGSGVDEVGFDENTNRVLIEVDPLIFCPTEVDTLIGDSSKTKNVLNWHAKTSFKELVHLMVESDLKENGLDPDKFLKPCKMNS
jgi:GDPmannose 4,6-dehydratase